MWQQPNMSSPLDIRLSIREEQESLQTSPTNLDGAPFHNIVLASEENYNRVARKRCELNRSRPSFDTQCSNSVQRRPKQIKIEKTQEIVEALRTQNNTSKNSEHLKFAEYRQMILPQVRKSMTFTI